MSDYIVKLPTPHAKQKEFIYSPAKRKIIVAGRRGGKTTGAAMLAADKALEGRRVLEAAPTSDQTSAFWDNVKAYFADPIARKAMYKNDSDRLLELPNGGRIRCKTAHDADSLRGDYADLLILDEYSFMKPSAWEEVGQPMLLDNDGDAVFIFTPNRKNHAFILYQQAVANDTGRYGHWHFTSYDNPHLNQAALDVIKEDMTEDAYRQEIMAEFLDNEGVVFRNIAACMNAEETKPEEHKGHYILAGVDWGKQNDFTAISIGCDTCKCELARDRYNKIDWHYQYGRLEQIINKWHVSLASIETNSIGDPGFEALQRAGLPVAGFDTLPSTKAPLIENMALAFERTEWQFQSDPVWTGELEAYERKVLPLTGRSQYSAPEGLHDDTVIARALMLWCVNRRTQLIEDPFANW